MLQTKVGICWNQMYTSLSHTHTHTYMCVYENIHKDMKTYMYGRPETVSFYHNSLVWLSALDASSWDRNPPIFMLDSVSCSSAISAPYLSSGIIMHFPLHFALSDTGVLNSLEELCITQVAAVNAFGRVLILQERNVYIIIRRQSRVLRWIETLQWG